MRYEYLLLLLVCLAMCGMAALYYRVFGRVVSEYKRLAFAVLPVAGLFFVWDVIAILRGHWFFNEKFMVGFEILLVPVEEILFFLVIPFISVLTWEIIRFALVLYRKKI